MPTGLKLFNQESNDSKTIENKPKYFISFPKLSSNKFKKRIEWDQPKENTTNKSSYSIVIGSINCDACAIIWNVEEVVVEIRSEREGKTIEKGQ